MSNDLKPDEDEMSLVQERYEEVEDQPIEDDNLSVFDERELKSQDYHNIRDYPKSIDFSEDEPNEYARHRANPFGGLSTIKEVNESRSNISNLSNLRSRFGTPSKEVIKDVGKTVQKMDDTWENAGRMNDIENQEKHNESTSFQFGNAVDAMNQYEEHYHSDKNKADRMFPEDDMRFRGSNVFFDKENSWEPSVADWRRREKSPAVVNDKSPSLNVSQEKVVPTKVFGSLSIDNSQSIPSKKLHTTEIQVQTTPKTPEKKFTNSFGTPKARRSHPETSTPKGVDGCSRRASQLEDTRISSIHGDSPSRAHFFNSPSNTTAQSNMTVNQSLVNNIVQGRSGDLALSLKDHLEGIRKMRPTLTVKPNFAKNSSSRSDRSSIHTALETSKVPINKQIERDTSKFSISRNCSSDMKRSDDSKLSSIGNIQRNERARREDEMRKLDGESRRESSNSMRSSSRASTSSTTSTSSRADRGVIKTSGRRMAFGAVEVGDKMTMELEMENISDRQINVITSVDSQSPAFEIIDNNIRGIMPGHKNTVRVAFSPIASGRYQVMLKIFVQTMNLSYYVPVWGCGGLVKIEPIGSDISLSSSNDFVLRTSNYSKIAFKLKNEGCRDGFARIDVYDSLMKPVKCRISPSHALMIRRRDELQVEVCLDEMLTTISENRSSSSLSSSRPSSSLSSISSKSSSRRSTLSGADLIVEIKWGEELLRQRLKMLESDIGRWIDIDGHDFTKCKFVGEQKLNPTKGFPKIMEEDKDLFIASYRTTNVLVFSTRSSSRCSNGYRSASVSLDPSETTILETTAFRHQTFVPDPDATVMSRR